ncbi:MAG: flagellar motor protein MotB [Elusimicrobia bacterium]|nr:flagellar motor protein MotB [Elusimicrobiota bacterium]
MYLHRDREEDVEDLLNRSSLWAVTYGDLMSYLMVLFLILFSLAINGRGKFAESLAKVQKGFGGAAEGKNLARMIQRSKELDAADELDRQFSGRGIEKFATVQVNEQRIRITLSEPVLFDSGSSELKVQARSVLGLFAEAVRQLPNRIEIEGHTDDVPVRGGRYRSNWELSMARAYSVIDHLASVQKIAPRRISGSGYGEYMPIGANDTPEGRGANRRIEISLLRAD